MQVLEELEQALEQAEPESSSAPIYIVAHDYTPSFEDELALTQGTAVTILQQLDGGWWQGQVDDA